MRLHILRCALRLCGQVSLSLRFRIASLYSFFEFRRTLYTLCVLGMHIQYLLKASDCRPRKQFRILADSRTASNRTRQSFAVLVPRIDDENEGLVMDSPTTWQVLLSRHFDFALKCQKFGRPKKKKNS